MKKKYLLAACLILTLFTGYKGFGQVATYYLKSNYLYSSVGYLQNCGNGNYYDYYCGGDQIGFAWTDGLPAGSIVTSVNIAFCEGVSCATASIPYYMNGTFEGDFGTGNNCNCNAYLGTASVSICGANYNVDGANYFLFSPTSCFGFYENVESNFGYYAIVTVAYNNGTGSGCNFGSETNPGTPAAAACSPTWAFAADCGPGATVSMPAADVLANTYYDFEVASAGGNTVANAIYVAGNCITSSNVYSGWVSSSPSVTIGTDRAGHSWCSSSSSVLDYRYSAPAVSITGGTGATGTATVCPGATTSYTLSTTNVSPAGTNPYTWSIASSSGGAGATFSSTASGSPNVTFTNSGAAGTVVLKCTVTNNNKCSASANTFTITVNSGTSAVVSGGTTPICSGSSPGTLTVTASGGTGYQWYNSSGAIAGATATTYSVPALTSSNSYYCVVASSGGCPSITSNTVAITVSQPSSYGTIVGATSSGSVYLDPACTYSTGTVPQVSLTGYSGSPVWYFESGEVATAAGAGTGTPTWSGAWINGASAGTCCFPVNPVANGGGAAGFEVIVTNAPCPSVTSPVILIEQENNPAPTSLTASTTAYCTTSVPGTITLTATYPYGSNTLTNVLSNYSSIVFYSGSCGGTILATVTPSSITYNATTATATYTFTPPTTAGSYTYYTQATSPACTAGGCSGGSVTITVSTGPTVNAGSGIAAICQGGTTSALGGSFGGSATSAVWSDGGAGGTFANNGGSTPNTATYTASASAPATVTLTLTTAGGSCGAVTASKTITVNPNPTVNAGGALAAVCQGGTTAALGGSFGGGASSAIWTDGGAGGTFANNTGSTPSSTTYTAAANSPASVTLTLTTSGGSCGTTSANKTLTVNPNPTVSAGSALAAICQGGTTAALGGSFGGGATSAVWSDGGAGGTFANNTGSTPGTATYTASASAPASVTLTLTTAGGSCGTTSATKTVTVNPNPTVNAGGALTAVCQGGTTAALGGSFGGGATSAVWTDGGAGGIFTNNTGTTPATTTYTAAANAPASVTLTLTTSGGSCSNASASKTLTVNPNPTVSTGPATAAICQGGTTAALGGSFGGGATSAVWSDGGAGGTFANNTGSTPGTATYTASASAPSSVTLTLTTSGGSCGTTSATKTITVNPNPTVNAGGAMTAICQGGTSAALGGSFGGGATLATWSDGGAGGSFANNGGSTPATATYTASTTAPASVTLTLTTFGGSCGTVSASKTITINPLPAANAGSAVAAICQGGTSAALGGSFGGGATAAIWSDGGAGGTFANNTGSTPGTATYTSSLTSATPVTLTLTTSGGVCGTTTATKQITVNPNPVISSVAVSPALCNGSSTGSITITATSGSPAYTYSIDSGVVFQNSNVFDSLPAGSDYVLKVSDTRGCSSFYAHNDVTITQPTVLRQTDTSVKASCANVFDGSITVTASGGTAPYNYSLNGGPSQSGNTFNSLGAGNYIVTVGDANGCFDTAHVSVSNSYAVSDSLLNQTNVSCFGGADGAMTVQLSGGVPAYSYSDNGSTFQSSPTFTGLTAGNYVVTLRDSRGCTDFLQVSITQPALLDIQIDSIKDVLCNGQSQGAIYITVNGGTPSYTYTWSNGSTTRNVTNLAAGTYNVTVLDSKGCNSSSGATITQPLPLFVNVATAHNLTCYDDSSGFVYVSVSGGVPPYGYSWSDGATTQDISNLVVGTYSLTVLDANACQVTVSQTISQPTQLTSAISETNVSCNGAANGSVTFNASGGVTPYKYLWNNGATTQSLSNVSGGFYSVSLTDAKGCTLSNSTTVSEPAALVITINSTNASCNGGNGTVTTSVSGGTGTITYLWSNSATTANLTNVVSGTYSVVATDANSCTASASVTVSQPTALVLNGTVADVLCSGGSNGSVAITVNGGVAPYSYDWSNNATTQNINGVIANTYTVTATDANHCTVTASFNVTSPAALTASIAGTNVTCHGQGNGTATLTTGGGTTPYSFNWSNFQATQNLTGLSGGTYYVTITDANGCTKRDSIIITEPAAIVLGITSTNVSCNGGSTGSVTTTVSGGTGTITYLWGNNATTASLTNVPANTYSVTITDANLCTASASATVTQPTALVINGTAANVSCSGGSNGSVDVTVNGGVFPYTYLWSNNATTQNINGVPANTYTVTATDANLCTITASFTVTSPSALTSSIAGTNVTCHGQANGTATLTVGGGTTPYTFNWSNFHATQNLTGLSGGTYYVIITDANGCTRRDSVIITEPAAIVLGISSTNVSCNGGATGSVTTSVSGGTGTITYLWSNNATTANLAGVVANTYSVTITDANLCTASASATVTQPTALVINGTVANVLCSGGSNGSVAITVNGGVFPYTYLWSNNATTQNINGVVANTYTVTATDANLCTITASFNVTAPSALTSSIVGTNVTCNGQANGTANLTVGGGTTPYSFLWSNFHATQNLTGLSGGTYYVIITDANGCTARDSVIISEPAAIVLGITSTNVSCNGGSTGSVTTAVTGGTGTITYLWSNNATTSGLINVPANTYSVTITDANSCTASASATVTQPSALAINGTAANVLCSGGSNGSVAVTVNGGVFPYTYLWSNNATTQNINGVTANTYTVTATDANLCTITASFTVTSPTPVVSSVTGTNVTCHGQANGTATLQVSGGTSPYTFNWSNFQATQNLTGLSGGTYYVIITDANGCTKRDSIIITEPPAIAVTLTATNVACNGNATGTVTTTVNGGVTPYTYNWSNTATTPNLTNLSAGTYILTGSDNVGCIFVDSVTITQPTALVINGTAENVLCAGGNNGSISITVNGGVFPYTYSWSNNATTQNVNNLTGGVTYTVTATDANLCTITASFTITSPTALSATITGTNVSCFGARNGTASVSVGGGTTPYTYLWSTFSGTPSIDSLNGGLYFVIVTDANSCSIKDSVYVNEPSQIVVNATVTQITCYNQNNGAINVTVTGGVPTYNYNWSPALSNSPNQTALAGASYLLTVTDASLCSATAEYDITNPAAIGINYVPSTPKCYGDSNGVVNLIVSGGVPAYSYAWSYANETSAQLTGVPMGIYIVTVTDSRGCTATDTANVATPSLLYTSGVIKNVTCFGDHDGQVIVTVYGGTLPYNFLWSPSGASTQNLYNLSGSSNILTVTDANGCQVSSLYIVHEPALLTLGLGASSVTCFGGSNGSVTALPAGGTIPYRYLWSNFSTDSLQPAVPAGLYGLQLTDSDGCYAFDSILVTQPTQITVTALSNPAICYNTATGSLDATATGGTPGYTYEWNNGGADSAINTLSAGTYIVTVTDTKNCSVSSSFVVTQGAKVIIDLATYDPICYGGNTGAVTALVTGGAEPYHFIWSSGTGDSAVAPGHLIAGTYTVTVTDNVGCTTTASATLNQPDAIVISPSITGAKCFNSATGLVIANTTGGTAPFTYSLNGIAQPNDTFTQVLPGSYDLLATDVNGCSGTDTFTIATPNFVSVTLSVNDPIIITGMQTQLIAVAASNAPITGYIWSPIVVDSGDVFDFSGCSDTLDCSAPYVKPPFTTVFSVTAVNADLCTATDTVTVTVTHEIPPAFIPSAFTPNNDGLNDRFTFAILGATTIETTVFDRWGQKVFYDAAQPNGISNSYGWDGTSGGKDAPQDTYVYQLKVSYYNGTTKSITGTVTLMR